MAARKRSTSRKPTKVWPRSATLDELLRVTAEKGKTPAQIGAVLAASKTPRTAKAEAQSFVDVRERRKRLWVNDAEAWATLLGGRIQTAFDDPVAMIGAIAAALPPGHEYLQKAVRAAIREDRDDTDRPKKARAVGSLR